MDKSIERECTKELACAIVRQAAEDYLEAKKNLYLEGLMYEPNKAKIREYKYDISSIKRFFNSDYYSNICSIDGPQFLNDLDKEFERRKENNFKEE